MSVRLPGPERRESIMKAAQRLFSEKGYHGVSIDEIAREVDVSPAILYRHFKSKQLLYDAVLQAMAAGVPVVLSTVAVNVKDSPPFASADVSLLAEPARTGFVVHDVDDIAEGIRMLIGDPVRAAEMGAAGRRRMEAQFTWNEVANRLVAGFQAARSQQSRP